MCIKKLMHFFREIKYEGGKIYWIALKDSCFSLLFFFIITSFSSLFFFLIDVLCYKIFNFIIFK